MSTTKKPLTILFASVNVIEHTCTGAASELVLRGHRVIFVLETSLKGKLSSFGFEEYIYQEERDEKPNKTWLYGKLFLILLHDL